MTGLNEWTYLCCFCQLHWRAVGSVAGAAGSTAGHVVSSLMVVVGMFCVAARSVRTAHTMEAPRIKKVVWVFVHGGRLRSFVDYESYSNFVAVLLGDFVRRDTDEELFERCLESIIV